MLPEAKPSSFDLRLFCDAKQRPPNSALLSRLPLDSVAGREAPRKELMKHSRPLAPTLTLSLGLLLCALSPAFAQDAKLDSPLLVKVPVEEGAVLVDRLVRAWAQQTGRRAFVSAQLANIKVRMEVGAHSLGREELLALLQDQGVVIIESRTRVRALQARDVQGRFDATRAPVYTQNQALPALNMPVTLVYEVQHGSGSSIFANLRGILSRDASRVGNILYVQGPERLIISDFAPKVARYRQLIQILDRPATSASQLVTVYEVPAATWTQLKGLPTQEAAAALAKLSAERKVTCHEEARVSGTRFSLERVLRREEGQFQLQVRVWDPSTKAKGAPFRKSALRLSISLNREGKGKERQSRQIELVAPAQSETALVSAMLDSGQDSTHLVVAFRPAR